MKIGFIGFGHMARAIAKGLNCHGYSLYASSPSLQAQVLDQGVHTHYDNLYVLERVDIVILAVKPKDLKLVWEEIREKITPQQLIISIAAGISLSWFKKTQKIDSAIIRAMPNIAVSVGKGITALFANNQTTEQQKKWAQLIFSHSGTAVWVEKENELDTCTALSGSGPAYIFLFMDAMIQGACKLGLNKKTAELLTFQTFQGALSLAQEGDASLIELREQVTSPGGTTAAAIEVLQQHGILELIESAMTAAFKRAQQLERSLK